MIQKIVIIVLSTLVCTESIFIANCKVNSEFDASEKNVIGKFYNLPNYEEIEGGLTKDYYLTPKSGIVNNYKVAIKIAETILLSVYGKKIYKDVPYNAYLKNDSIWVVAGTIKDGAIGGTFEVVMRKNDGAILRVVEEK